jgi:hypothetical protein
VGIAASGGDIHGGGDFVRTRSGDLGDGGSAWGGMRGFGGVLAFGNCTNGSNRPGQIVSDEVAGQALALLLAS